MKHLCIVVLWLILVPVIAAVQSRPDFSGTWVLDIEKSWAGAPGEATLSPETLLVKQTASELSFERSSEPGTRVVRLDGEEHVIDSPMGRTKVRATWRGDLLGMTLMFELPRERSKDALGQVAVSFLAWSLSDNGKTLTVNGNATLVKAQPTGEKVTEELTVKRIYQKQ